MLLSSKVFFRSVVDTSPLSTLTIFMIALSTKWLELCLKVLFSSKISYKSSLPYYMSNTAAPYVLPFALNSQFLIVRCDEPISSVCIRITPAPHKLAVKVQLSNSIDLNSLKFKIATLLPQATLYSKEVFTTLSDIFWFQICIKLLCYENTPSVSSK